jgi:hypothetical protein
MHLKCNLTLKRFQTFQATRYWFPLKHGIIWHDLTIIFVALREQTLKSPSSPARATYYLKVLSIEASSSSSVLCVSLYRFALD